MAREERADLGAVAFEQDHSAARARRVPLDRAPAQATSRKSLRLLGSVGEPINPEAWHWYYNVVGEQRCPIVDTWWQTESGASVIAPLPGAIATKPGSATLPFFGVEPVIVDDDGRVLDGECEGRLCLRDGGPGMLRTLYRDHERFVQTYFSVHPGLYFTGDGARRDKDGYYWITGRVDDVINVSGHGLRTAEVESALVAHPEVAEARRVLRKIAADDTTDLGDTSTLADATMVEGLIDGRRGIAAVAL